MLTVCTADDCKEHRGAYQSSFNAPAEKAKRAKEAEKQRQAAEQRRRLFAAVRVAAPSTFSPIELGALVEDYVAAMQQDSVKALVQALGIETRPRRSASTAVPTSIGRAR